MLCTVLYLTPLKIFDVTGRLLGFEDSPFWIAFKVLTLVSEKSSKIPLKFTSLSNGHLSHTGWDKGEVGSKTRSKTHPKTGQK